MLTPVASAGPVANIEFGMKFSRQARNEMRLYRIELGDIEAAIAQPLSRAEDERGNARLVGETPGGRRTVVVVARGCAGRSVGLTAHVPRIFSEVLE